LLNRIYLRSAYTLPALFTVPCVLPRFLGLRHRLSTRHWSLQRICLSIDCATSPTHRLQLPSTTYFVRAFAPSLHTIFVEYPYTTITKQPNRLLCYLWVPIIVRHQHTYFVLPTTPGQHQLSCSSRLHLIKIKIVNTWVVCMYVVFHSFLLWYTSAVVAPLSVLFILRSLARSGQLALRCRYFLLFSLSPRWSSFRRNPSPAL